jgi:hypothetical protein
MGQGGIWSTSWMMQSSIGARSLKQRARRPPSTGAVPAVTIGAPLLPPAAKHKLPIDTPFIAAIRATSMPEDPITRLQFARDEIDWIFGEGYAAAHPDVVTAVMLTAAIDLAALAIAGALEHVAAALLEAEPIENGSGIVRAQALVVAR